MPLGICSSVCRMPQQMGNGNKSEARQGTEKRAHGGFFEVDLAGVGREEGLISRNGVGRARSNLGLQTKLGNLQTRRWRLI